MGKKIELLVTLRGDDEFWPAGHVFDYDQMPREIAAEIAMNRGTVRIFEDVRAPVVPPPPPPEPQPSLSDVAKDLLGEEPKEEEPEEKPKYELDYKGGGWYNVIDTETGEKVNAEAVRKSAAKKLIRGLSAKPSKPTLVVRDEE